MLPIVFSAEELIRETQRQLFNPVERKNVRDSLVQEWDCKQPDFSDQINRIILQGN